MYTEDQLLALSGLQHLMFCERQWGLIHIEQMWEENRLTAEGRVMHEKAHQAGSEGRPGVRIARGLRLRSLQLGLVGRADVVEFHRDAEGRPAPGLEGLWRAYPVEYKRGRPKRDACDEVQLCAQAMCLEEMFGCEVREGALYYGQPRRRDRVELEKELRTQVETLARRMHELYASGRTPAAVYEAKCRSCSLLELCMPKALEKAPRVARYLATALDGE